MAKRPALIPQADATRLLKAAKAAGYGRARLIRHPDGRIEIVAEEAFESAPVTEESPFALWRRDNARQA